MDKDNRLRQLAHFERLGEKRVRLYCAIDGRRFLGNWEVIELANEWLTARETERKRHPWWQRLKAR